MSEWVGQTCCHPQYSTDCRLKKQKSRDRDMIPKVVFILILFSGVTVALFVGLLPNITSLLYTTRQLLGLVESTSTEVKIKQWVRQAGKDTFCSKAFAFHAHVSPKDISDGDSETSVLPFASRSKKKEDLNQEALAAMHLAKDMEEKGKVDKALRLYTHALSLAPDHPDLLNNYGEFLEKKQHDILKAEHMYCSALSYSPKHTMALTNRKRTLPVVEEIDTANFNRIDKKRQMLMQVPENHPGLRRMMKEQYFRHIHHTTALEGNTFTLAQTRLLVENRLAIGGKSIIEHNEILGMDAALSFVNTTLIHRIGAITAHDILDIHKRVLGFVDPIGAGIFRTTQVFVGDYTPPLPSEVPSLISEFIEWINCEEALSLHPIELAALVHYKLVWIHPFYDGNGRTSRLLMNLILLQAGYPPVIIAVEDKPEYYEHLKSANDGDIRPFIRFIAKCTEQSVDEFLLASIENARELMPGLRNPRDDGRTIIIGN